MQDWEHIDVPGEDQVIDWGRIGDDHHQTRALVGLAVTLQVLKGIVEGDAVLLQEGMSFQACGNPSHRCRRASPISRSR